MTNKEYVFDFETYGEEYYKKHGYTKIYLWDACELKTYKHKHGTTMESFLDYILREGVSGYFHNLAFDIEFILYGLDARGYTSVKDITELEPNTYYILKQGMAIYKISICSAVKTIGKKKKRTKKVITTLKDSLKLLNFKVDEIGDAFNLPINKQFNQDYYNRTRADEITVTEEDIKGCEADTEVVARALDIMKDNEMDKLTLSSSAFNNWKKILQQNGYSFNKLFPTLGRECDIFLRKGYFGGYCFCMPEKVKKVFNNVRCYDVNSEYPYVYTNYMLPYGKPVYFIGQYEYDDFMPLYVQHIVVSFTLKEGYVPTVQSKKAGIYSQRPEYLVTTDNLILELFLTSVDLELLLEHYNIEYIDYIDGYKFYASDMFFKDFSNKYMSMKQNAQKEGNKVKRQIAKDNVNSLYGKFAEGLEMEQYITEKDSNGIIHIILAGTRESNGIYLPVAMFTTACARRYLIDAIQSNYNDFLYCDTDSIYLTNEAKNIIIDIDNSGTLGEWKLERVVDNFKMLQPKRYTYKDRSNNKGKVKCAGMSKDLQQKMTDTYKDEDLLRMFDIGYRDIQIKKRKVKGGCVLFKTDFELKE